MEGDSTAFPQDLTTLKATPEEFIFILCDLAQKDNLSQPHFTCKTKCLCLVSSSCKSPLSKWDLNNDRYSFWRLMSVASIKAPIWVSICCLQLEKYKEKIQDFQLNSYSLIFFLKLNILIAIQLLTYHKTWILKNALKKTH